MTRPKLRLIAMCAPLVIVTGLAGVWIAKPSGVTRLTVARGASVHVQLQQALASDQSKPGDQFVATLTEPVWVDGMVAIPQGARIRGKVVDAFPSSKLEGPARLRLTLNSIKMDRMTFELHTTDVAQYGSGYVNPHWEIAGATARSFPGPVAEKGRAMLIAAPAGARTKVAARRVPESLNVQLPAETTLKFRLIEPLVLPHKK